MKKRFFISEYSQMFLIVFQGERNDHQILRHCSNVLGHVFVENWPSLRRIGVWQPVSACCAGLKFQVLMFCVSNLYQIAQLGENEDEPSFLSTEPEDTVHSILALA